MSASSARAPAKTNLHLTIDRRREDGYHDVTTVLQSIALHDTLVFEAVDGPFDLRCNDCDVPTDSRNLVWRAAAAYADAIGRGPLRGVRVTLEKGVPAQAGLGGGSSDVIATVRGLAHCWGVELDRDLLVSIGRGLGSDVPFFVDGGTALGTGRGDAVTALPDIPGRAVVVVRPAFGIGTADAYQWVAESRGRQRQTPAAVPEWRGEPAAWESWLSTARNDFEPVVIERYPVIGEATSELRRAGAELAMLSGSGSAVVGLFASADAAAHAASRFEPRGGWRVWVSRTVSRLEYAQLVAPQPV